MFGQILKYIKSVLFPIFCAGCGAEGEWLCAKCFGRAGFSPVSRCPGCAKKNDGSLCLGCRGFFPLDGALAMFEYDEDKPPAKLVKNFKYCFARDICPVWEKISAGYFESNYPLFLNESPRWALIPVPLYPRRERERGYNQAELIARIIAEKINSFGKCQVSVESGILKRVRPTAQQAKLTKEERVNNVKDAFVATQNILPENAILTDDIFTSGVTLFECARLLKKGGVKRVWAITLARSLYV